MEPSLWVIGGVFSLTAKHPLPTRLPDGDSGSEMLYKERRHNNLS